MRQRSTGSPGLVSVIIPCYNSARFVPMAIESALGQTYRHLEVIVVNDGSTDRFLDAVAPFGGRVKVIDQENAGVSVARNRGIAGSDGEFVAFLDADDSWVADKIARQVEALAANPVHVLVHTKPQYVDSNGAALSLSKQWQVAEGYCTSRLLAHNTITTSSVLVRRAALPDAPFCERLRGVEDWDLWLRLSREWPFAYLDEPLTGYRLHDSNTSSDQRKMARGSLQVFERFLSNDLPPAMRREAERHERTARRWLAHLEYEQRDFKRARSLYAKDMFTLGPVGLARLTMTFLPDMVRSVVQSGWHRLQSAAR